MICFFEWLVIWSFDFGLNVPGREDLGLLQHSNGAQIAIYRSVTFIQMVYLLLTEHLELNQPTKQNDFNFIHTKHPQMHY